MKRKKIVRIVTDNHHYDTLLRQLPLQGFTDFEFTTEPVDSCDVLVVLEYPTKDIKVQCNPANTFLWSMEPPVEEWDWIRKTYKYFRWIITTDKQVNSPKIVYRDLAIPWQIEFDYDELKKLDVLSPKKSDLSFITSNYAARGGHRRRLQYLEKINGKLDFDLWGRGFRTMEKKSDALLPYKYTILVENSSFKDYWSEKLADAFLCGCLPFYYGCKNIDDYFEPGSVIKIDIHNPKRSIEIIREAIQNKEWEKRQQLIQKARNKILDEYQFFPALIGLINKYCEETDKKEVLFIPELSHHPSDIRPFSLRRNYYLLKKFFFKKRYLDPESRLFGFTTYK